MAYVFIMAQSYLCPSLTELTFRQQKAWATGAAAAATVHRMRLPDQMAGAPVRVPVEHPAATGVIKLWSWTVDREGRIGVFRGRNWECFRGRRVDLAAVVHARANHHYPTPECLLALLGIMPVP